MDADGQSSCSTGGALVGKTAEEIWFAHQDWVANLIHRFCRGRVVDEDKKDLLSDIGERVRRDVTRKAASGEIIQSEEALIFRITYNACMSALRGIKFNLHVSLPEDADQVDLLLTPERRTQSSEVEDEVLYLELRRLYVQALVNLKATHEDWYCAYALCRGKGYTVREAADELGSIKKSTVANHCKAAEDFLKSWINQHWER